MSGEVLRVTTSHLRELAAKQARAAAEITAATDVVEGVDTAMLRSHGVIAWSTAAAVQAIQPVRRAAGNHMAAASHAMSEDLRAAAARYAKIDGAMGARLDQEMETQ
jgi:hypothetical protein